MFNTIQDFASLVLPAKRKKAPNGWITFNCPVCSDKRMRGGMLFGSNGECSYHCFNCPHKAYYKPGYTLSYSFRKLFTALGVDDNEIRRLVLEAIRVQSIVAPEVVAEAKEKQEIKFTARQLPLESQSFMALAEFYTIADKSFPDEFNQAVKTAYDRKVDLRNYDFYWSSNKSLRHKLIIPFYWKNDLIGYSLRALDDQKPKYINFVDTGYVFNVNKQQADWQFVIVTEGVFDALSLDCVALLHNEVSEQQADIIDSLGKQVIVVPHFDKAGDRLIDEALKYNWNVSFPIWRETCKDINEAVIKYGKLFVMKTILDAVETSKLKIELRKKL
jgi:hypothetical protein